MRVIVIVGILILLAVATEDNVKVKTTNAGTVIGRTVKLKDGETKIHEFHNIYYAEAPVGELRFRPPVRKIEKNSDKEVDATDDTAVKCIQLQTGEGKEDCLVLTVRSGDLSASKPVVVWIHGGAMAYHYGASKGFSFDSEVTNRVDAVTVNINYRLGFLGFAAVRELWDEEAGVYANNGIRDVIAALDWIKDNIAAFGGDPNSVTLLGESGGATAVLALTCSPLANNKFHAGIAMSGAPEFKLTHVEVDARQRIILYDLGCTQETPAARKQCLLDLDATAFSFRKIKRYAGGAAYFKFPMTVYGEAGEKLGLLAIDPVVVPFTPRTLKSADFTPATELPIIVSSLAQDIINTSKRSKWLSKFPDDMDNLIAELGPQFENLKVDAKVTKKRRRKRQKRQAKNTMNEALALYPNKSPAELWSQLVTDMRVTCPTNDAAEAMSEAPKREIYRLYVTHRSSQGTPSYHGYDTDALFGYSAPWSDIELKEMDIKFENHYIELVKKFSREKKVEDGWDTFPGSTMTYENSDKISKVGGEKPQEGECKKLAELDLVKYGWHNK
jgi:carboxylesterase type B